MKTAVAKKTPKKWIKYSYKYRFARNVIHSCLFVELRGTVNPKKVIPAINTHLRYFLHDAKITDFVDVTALSKRL